MLRRAAFYAALCMIVSQPVTRLYAEEGASGALPSVQALTQGEGPPRELSQQVSNVASAEAVEPAPSVVPEVGLPKEEALVAPGDVPEVAAAPAQEEGRAAAAGATGGLSQPVKVAAPGLGERLKEEIAGRWQAYESQRWLEVAPYVEDRRWRWAVGLLEANDCAGALLAAGEVFADEAAERAAPAPVRYVLARMRLCAGEQARGKAELEALVGQDPVLDQLLARHTKLVRVLLPTAQVTYSTLGEALEGARQLVKEGKPAVALERLDGLLGKVSGSWEWYRVMVERAQVMERLGLLEESAEVRLAIWRRARGWKIGPEVEREVEALGGRLGRDLFTDGDRVERLRQMILRGDHKGAKAYVGELVRLLALEKEEARGWGLYREALSAEVERDRKRAVELFEQAEKLVRHEELRGALYMGWALALRRLDRDEEAVGLYKRLVAEYPRHWRCDEALYESGRLLHYMNRQAEARERFELLVGLYPESELAAEAIWHGAFAAYLEGNYEESDAALAHLIAHYGHVEDTSDLPVGLKAQYWRGVVALKRGDVLVAAAQLRRAQAMGPLTWYGRLAATRLAQLGAAPDVERRWALDASGLETLDGLRVADHELLRGPVMLARAGLLRDAQSELYQVSKLVGAPRDVDRLLAGIYQLQGRPDLAHWIMRKHIEWSGPTRATLRDWGVAYPMDYMDLSSQWGARYGVSPFFVQAIIRQESGFRPTASSPAGALGLMQLMPPTAKYTAKVFLEEELPTTRKALTEPAINVRLGTMYIRAHVAHARDYLPLALAGYNAGIVPLKRWFERYGDRELDAWVESITYPEARGYVRKVMTSYIVYSALYGDGPLPIVALRMPAQLGKWGEIPELAREVAALDAADVLAERFE
jgi:soluble lytic murein transglycosylase-like protein